MNVYPARLLPGGEFDLTATFGTCHGYYRLKGGVLTLRYDAFGRPRPPSIDAGGPGYAENYRRIAR